MPTVLWIIFVLGSLAIIWVSRNSLSQPNTHGFYRTFAWEILLVLFVLNIQDWFRNPWSWHQLLSWLLLMVSLLLAVQGFRLLRAIGKQDNNRVDPSLLGLEKTSRLVTENLYQYIRHPLYSSLLFLGWGIFFKSPSWLDGGLVLLITLFLTATAFVEEAENIRFFGEEYREYMLRSKRFIPFVF